MKQFLLAVFVLLAGVAKAEDARPAVSPITRTILQIKTLVPKEWECTVVSEPGKMGHPHGLGEPVFRMDFVNRGESFSAERAPGQLQRLHPSMRLHFHAIQEKERILKIVEAEREYSWDIPIYFAETKDFLIVTSPGWINQGWYTEEARKRVAPLEEAIKKVSTRPTAIAFETHDGYFVSNKFEPGEPASFVVLQDRKLFDEVFGVAMVMGDRSHRLPANAFDTKIVITAIKRGKAFWTFNVQEVAAAESVLSIRYTTASEPQPTAEFACPLIVSLPRGNYTSVVFIENGKPVKTIAIGGPIDRLVARLSADPLWQNGLAPTIDLPRTAPAEQVVSKVLEGTSFDAGKVAKYRIIELRQVSIENGGSRRYTAARVETNQGEKIVLFTHTGGGGWWSRVYESDSPGIESPKRGEGN